MPLFENETPEIGRPFVAISKDGRSDLMIYIRTNSGFVDTFGDYTYGAEHIDVDRGYMEQNYSEWVYCETRPYFEQRK